jgi:hypothetical protein
MNSALRYGKTSLTWGIVVSTVAWSMGLAALLTPFTAAQAVSSGDLIKASQAAVYYYGEDGKRYVFPNQKTYNTWYSDFSGVVTITDSELAAIPIGGNATYKPGVLMVKITTDPKVYAVDANGVLRPIADEATATALYGANWNQQIHDVPDAFFTNYSVGAPINSGGDFDPANATANASSINDDKNLSSGGTVGGGSLTVSLAADTPSTTTFPANVSRHAVTKVNLTNNTALDAVVDQVVIKRLGIASNTSIASVDLLGADMLPLNEFSKNLGSKDTATVNDDFTVPANSTMGVYISINSAASTAATAGELPILAINSMLLKGGGQVTGSFPVAGNHHVVNGTLTIGSATITPGGNEPAASTQEIGTKDFTASSFKIAAGSGEDVTIGRVIFKNNGSADIQKDVTKIRLVNANTSEILDATPTFLVNDKDKFAMDINRELEKGKNISVDVRYDVSDGSAKTVDIDVDQKADLEVKGDEYGFKILPAYERPAGTANTSAPFYAGPTMTIGNGTLRIESVAINPTEIAEGLDDTVIAKYKMIAKGEPIEVTSMGWSFDITNVTGSTGSSSDVTNVTIREVGGQVVAGPTDLTAHGVVPNKSNGSATTTDSFVVPTGETIYEVTGDLSTDFKADDKIQGRVFPATVTARGEVSGNTITPTPASAVASTNLTIKAATLAVSIASIPAAQTIVSGTQGLNATNIVLDGSNSGADVRITSVKIAQHHTGASFPDNLSGWKISVGGVNVPVNSESTSCAAATCATAGGDATTTLTINSGVLAVTKGTSKTLAVGVNVGTGATTGTFSLGVSNDAAAPGIAGIDSDAQSITPTFTASNGQTMTLSGGGTLNTAILTSDPKSNLVIGGSKVEVGRFTLQPKNEGANLIAFGLHVNSPDGGIVGTEDEINTLELCQVGGSCYGPITVNTNRATITPQNLTQTQNQEKTYVINATFNNINDSSPAEAGAGIRILIGRINANGTSVGSSSLTANGLGTAFNTFSVLKSIPTVAKISFAGGDLITGNSTEMDLFKLSVSADSAGPIGLWKMTFAVSTTTVDMKTDGYYIYESDSSSSLGDIISKGSDLVLTGGDATDNGHHLRAYLDINDDSGVEVGEHRVLNAGSTKYYTLRGTTRADHDGTADNESISTVLAGDNAFASTVATTTHGIDRRKSSVDNTSNTASGAAVADDFIWSDLNFDLYSTTTATRTPGWFNGYRVPGMNNTSSTAQTITD